MTAPARLDSACRAVCALGRWRVTHPQLQKILYVLQMVHMGRNEGRRLFDGSFVATDCGPVEPRLEKRARMFGSDPVRDVFLEARPFRPDDPRKALIDEVCADLLNRSLAELVAMTHWRGGAWAAHYQPGFSRIEIPDAAIRKEYPGRVAAAALRDGAEAA